jgi:ubiquinone/menaquinone biosynthesis C-methylase UbiE
MTPLDWSTAAKQAAIQQWSADPCGPEVTAAPGTAAYIEQMIVERRNYCRWFDDALDYKSTAGLDVLDVGCGQGIDLVQYARAGARVTGIDLTPRHVELAAEHARALSLQTTIVLADAEHLPFGDSSFDRVASNGVLHHTPDMPAALREIRRVLRPGGEARIIVYNRRSYHYWLNQVLWLGIARGRLLRERSMAGVLSGSVERSSIGARPLVRVYSPPTLRRMLVAAGFTHVSTDVGGFNVSDTPMTEVLARRTNLMDDPRVLDFLGRTGGWYVVGLGCRAP